MSIEETPDTKAELLKVLKAAHDDGYDSGWLKGKQAGISSIAISIDPGYPNKAQSWEIFQKRLNIHD